MDRENPAITTEIARPARAGGTTAVAVVKAAARNTPCSAPVTMRVATNHSKSGTTAGATTSTVEEGHRADEHVPAVQPERQRREHRAAHREAEGVGGEQAPRGCGRDPEAAGEQRQQPDGEDFRGARDERAEQEAAQHHATRPAGRAGDAVLGADTVRPCGR